MLVVRMIVCQATLLIRVLCQSAAAQGQGECFKGLRCQGSNLVAQLAVFASALTVEFAPDGAWPALAGRSPKRNFGNLRGFDWKCIKSSMYLEAPQRRDFKFESRARSP